MKNLLTPKSDLVFKLLFTKDTEILIDLINAVRALPEDRRVCSVEVLNPGIHPETVLQKFIILDIRAKDENNQQYDIEMQVQKYDTYPKRILFYVSRMIADQLSAGDAYGGISPVISIHFLDYEQFPRYDDFHFRFELRDEHHPHLRLTEDLCIHLFELPKFEKYRSKDPDAEKDLTEWLHFFNHAHEEGEKHMREHYTNPRIRKALEMLEKMSANEDVRLLVEERERALRDEAWALASARQEGEQIGLEKGKQVGGRERAMENARRLLQMNILTLEQIAEATGLDMDEVTALKEE